MPNHAPLDRWTAFYSAARRRERRRLGRAKAVTALALAALSVSCTMASTGRGLASASGVAGRTDPRTGLALAASSAPATIARPFSMAGSSPRTGLRAQMCLAFAVYYEAGSESEDGQRAVAQVVLNRVRHPAFPNSVCDVVYQGSGEPVCQFSFACDGAIGRQRASRADWERANRIAAEALGGAVYAPVGLATHYHTLAVAPFWSRSLPVTAVVGTHIFYRWAGASGQAAAFRQAYARSEPTPGPHPRVAAPSLVGPAAALLAAALPAPLPLAPAPPPTLSAAAVVDPALAGTAGAATPPAITPPAITPDDQILPRWRDSGKPIAR